MPDEVACEDLGRPLAIHSRILLESVMCLIIFFCCGQTFANKEHVDLVVDPLESVGAAVNRKQNVLLVVG